WDTHASRIGRPRVTVDYRPPADLVGDYATLDTGRKWPAIWCSHTLEHILDPQSFIRKLFDDLELGGVLCLTVPRAHDEFIYSHVNLFTEGVLCYRLVLAGFDLSKARIGVYDRNITVLTRKREVPGEVLRKVRFMPTDEERLKPFLPVPLAPRDSSSFGSVRWDDPPD